MNPSADMIDCRLSERSGRRHFFIPRGAENRRPLLPLVDRAAAWRAWRDPHSSPSRLPRMPLLAAGIHRIIGRKWRPLYCVLPRR